MSDSSKDVYLVGSTLTGEARANLLNNLATLFKKDVPTIERMLRKSHTLIKANVDVSLAEKYKEKIEAAGGQCELVEQGALPGMDIEPAAAKPALSVVRDESENNSSVAASQPVQSPAAQQQSSYQYSNFCNKCGNGLAPKQTRCRKCGAVVKTYSAKNKTLAGFLAFFLGGLGVHRFYLGQWWGIFYLIFFFTLIPALIALIEAIVFWCTSEETWEGKYGNVEDNSVVILIVAVGGFFGFIFIMGILAAIALPQYQIYVSKSQIQLSLDEVAQVKNKVENFYNKSHDFPSDGILIGLPKTPSSKGVKSIELGDGGAIVVTYQVTMHEEDPTIIWRPMKMQGETSFRWSCDEGGLSNRYRPKMCQTNGDHTNVQQNNRTTKKNVAGDSAESFEAETDAEKIIDSHKTKLTLSVKQSWQRQDSLQPQALLVVSSPRQDQFAMVFSEAKADFPKGVDLKKYVSLLKEGLKTTGSNSRYSEVEYTILHHLPVAHFEMNTNVSQLDLTYLIYVYETDTHYYRVLTWSSQEDFARDKSTLEKVAASFNLPE